ncbi:MAG: sigma-70 family RNA polymerase sigma factor [Firmicutes bacterium]|nr:sigma-70 family RNA polymerase sigma factor [Bacillota bacterium]
MANYKVEISGINTNNLKVLKSEETVELFKKYQAGDEKAKEELVNGNLKLVLSILKKFNTGKYNLDDLFQVGVIGLIKAIDNFDLSYNLQLSTYACPLIIGEIKRYIRDNTTIRVSRSIKERAYEIIKFKDEFEKTNGYIPSNEEIAKALNISEYEIDYAIDALKEPMSIFEPIYNDGGDTIYLFDQIADKKCIDSELDSLIALKKALNQIKIREREILTSRYILGKTQTELARDYNISQAQVSRIEKNAIDNIRKLIR